MFRGFFFAIFRGYFLRFFADFSSRIFADLSRSSVLVADEAEALRAEAPAEVAVGGLHVLGRQTVAQTLQQREEVY